MKLKQEYVYYQANKAKLLKEHSGRFVLVKGRGVIGFFGSGEEAYKVGLERFGNQPFLIKQITKEEEILQTPALVLGIL